MGSIALLAMAPSGETYMVRDEFGRTWLIQPPGAGDPRVIEPDVVELAVARHGFDRIDRDFPSWSDLDRFRQARAASAAPPRRSRQGRWTSTTSSGSSGSCGAGPTRARSTAPAGPCSPS